MTDARRVWRSLLRPLIAALLLAGVLWLAGPAALWQTLSSGRPGWLAAGLGFAVASNLASAWRWRSLAAWLGHRAPLDWSVATYFHAIAVNALLPGAVVAGDMFRAWSLVRRGCGRREAALSVVLDRVSGLWILLALAALALGLGGGAELAQLLQSLHWPSAVPPAPAAAAVLAAVLLMPLAVLRVLRGWAPAGSWGALLRRPGGLAEYLRQALGSLVVQALSVAALACAAQAYAVVLPLWLVAVTALPIFLMATLPISFGGWGTREAATLAVWGVFGVASAPAVGAALTYGAYAVAQALLSAVATPRALRLAGPGP